MDGYAVFDQAGFLVGRSGCYRMVFSIPLGNGTSIFARKSNSEIYMSDPVCLVNEDEIKVIGEPSKLGAVHSVFSEKAAFKLEYALEANSTTHLGFKRRFWKRMNVESVTLQLHSQTIGRKIEPFLARALKGELQQSGLCFIVCMHVDTIAQQLNNKSCLHITYFSFISTRYFDAVTQTWPDFARGMDL